MKKLILIAIAAVPLGLSLFPTQVEPYVQYVFRFNVSSQICPLCYGRSPPKMIDGVLKGHCGSCDISWPYPQSRQSESSIETPAH